MEFCMARIAVHGVLPVSEQPFQNWSGQGESSCLPFSAQRSFAVLQDQGGLLLQSG